MYYSPLIFRDLFNRYICVCGGDIGERPSRGEIRSSDGHHHSTAVGGLPSAEREIASRHFFFHFSLFLFLFIVDEVYIFRLL